MNFPFDLSLVMGLGSFLASLLFWYKGSVEKRYAAQRDFGHLRRNYEQLSQAVAQLGEELDQRMDAVDNRLQEISLILQFKLNIPPSEPPQG